MLQLHIPTADLSIAALSPSPPSFLVTPPLSSLVTTGLFSTFCGYVSVLLYTFICFIF